jgi:hypothetical protein
MTRYAVVSLALLAVFVPSAFADGGPVAGSDAGPAGITVRGHPSRYVALPTREGRWLRGSIGAGVESRTPGCCPARSS